MATAAETTTAYACLLGTRIDTRELEGHGAVAHAPIVLRRAGRGHVVVFRFGAYVAFGLGEEERRAVSQLLAPQVTAPFPQPESETAEIVVDPGRPGRVDASGRIVVDEASLERLQVVAWVLAKSILLAHYEQSVAAVFDRVDTLAERLRRGERPARGRELSREIGDTLLIQTRMVGRAEISEKPEMTWDDPVLDRLYERLSAEYELVERDHALSRKLELIALAARTFLDLVHERQGIRVEWYIVILIVVEIVLLVVDMLVRGG